MRKLFILLGAVLLLCSQANARTRYSGWCEQGGVTVKVGGQPPTTQTFQQSFTGSSCMVTVYLTGTTIQPPYIYGDDIGTVKSNPFPSSSNGYWFFYTDAGIFDVRFSGSSIASSFTMGANTVISQGYDTTVNPLTSFSVNISAGAAICTAGEVTYAGATLSGLAASSDNYIFLDSTNSCVPAVNTTGFPTTGIPVAEVLTGSSGVINIISRVGMPTIGGGGGSGGTPQLGNNTTVIDATTCTSASAVCPTAAGSDYSMKHNACVTAAIAAGGYVCDERGFVSSAGSPLIMSQTMYLGSAAFGGITTLPPTGYVNVTSSNAHLIYYGGSSFKASGYLQFTVVVPYTTAFVESGQHDPIAVHLGYFDVSMQYGGGNQGTCFDFTELNESTDIWYLGAYQCQIGFTMGGGGAGPGGAAGQGSYYNNYWHLTTGTVRGESNNIGILLAGNSNSNTIFYPHLSNGGTRMLLTGSQNTVIHADEEGPGVGNLVLGSGSNHFSDLYTESLSVNNAWAASTYYVPGAVVGITGYTLIATIPVGNNPGYPNPSWAAMESGTVTPTCSATGTYITDNTVQWLCIAAASYTIPENLSMIYAPGVVGNRLDGAHMGNFYQICDLSGNYSNVADLAQNATSAITPYVYAPQIGLSLLGGDPSIESYTSPALLGGVGFLSSLRLSRAAAFTVNPLAMQGNNSSYDPYGAAKGPLGLGPITEVGPLWNVGGAVISGGLTTALVVPNAPVATLAPGSNSGGSSTQFYVNCRPYNGYQTTLSSVSAGSAAINIPSPIGTATAPLLMGGTLTNYLNGDTISVASPSGGTSATATLSATSVSGTLALVNSSATVVGTGTTFTSLTVGEYLVFVSDSTGTPYQISAIGSNTSLTLTSGYSGTSTGSTTGSEWVATLTAAGTGFTAPYPSSAYATTGGTGTGLTLYFNASNYVQIAMPTLGTVNGVNNFPLGGCYWDVLFGNTTTGITNALSVTPAYSAALGGAIVYYYGQPTGAYVQPTRNTTADITVTTGGQVTSPQYCIGVSCITAWSGGGTVTSIATTAPLGGGTITGSGTLTCSTCLTATTPTQYGVMLGAGTQALGFTAQGASNMPLIGQGAANPIFSTVGHPSSCTQGGLVYGSTSTQMTCGSLLTQYGVVLAGASGSSPVSTAQLALNMPLIGQGAANPIASTIAYPTSLTAGGLVYASTTTAFVSTSAGTAKQIVLSGGTGAPTMIDFPDTKIVLAANCVSTVAGSGWNTTLTPACIGGSNNLGGYLPFVDASVAQFEYELPADWDTASQPYIAVHFLSNSNTSGTVIFQAAVACYKSDGSTTSDPAFNTADVMTTKTMATATRGWSTSVQSTQVTSGNSCVPGGTMLVKITRNIDTASAAVWVTKAVITTPRLLTVQAN